MGLYHDDQSNENVKKANSVLLRNRQIQDIGDIVGQISPSYVFGHHSSWPSLSSPTSKHSDKPVGD